MSYAKPISELDKKLSSEVRKEGKRILEEIIKCEDKAKSSVRVLTQRGSNNEKREN